MATVTAVWDRIGVRPPSRGVAEEQSWAEVTGSPGSRLLPLLLPRRVTLKQLPFFNSWSKYAWLFFSSCQASLRHLRFL